MTTTIANTVLTKTRLTMSAIALALCLVVGGGLADDAQADHWERVGVEIAISNAGDNSATNSGDTGDALASGEASFEAEYGRSLTIEPEKEV